MRNLEITLKEYIVLIKQRNKRKPFQLDLNRHGVTKGETVCLYCKSEDGFITSSPLTAKIDNVFDDTCELTLKAFK